MSATRFTALILFTGPEHPQASSIIFETLSPFAISIVDSRHFLIRDRVFSTALIALDPAHLPAIEADLIAAAERIGFDVAIDIHPEAADIQSRALYRNTIIAPEFSPTGMQRIFEALAAHGSIVIFSSITKTDTAHELMLETAGLDPLPVLQAHSADGKVQ